ncbi:MAG: hypothetical protein VB078_05510 [Clostridiaceae bacterium]|nr:hypothetical protein [Clostridiaceae bacterium]
MQLTPKSSGSMEAEFSLLTSAYSRKAGNIRNLLENAEILYLDKNKDRANIWLRSLRVQFPSHQPQYGSIGIIVYAGDHVNITGKTLAELGGIVLKDGANQGANTFEKNQAQTASTSNQRISDRTTAQGSINSLLSFSKNVKDGPDKNISASEELENMPLHGVNPRDRINTNMKEGQGNGYGGYNRGAAEFQLREGSFAGDADGGMGQDDGQRRFIREAAERGQTYKNSERKKGSGYRYTAVKVEDYTINALEAEKELEVLGIPHFVFKGNVEVYANGKVLSTE